MTTANHSSNPALSQLLGLCPLLAISHTFFNSLALGLATLLVLVCANGLLASLRHFIPPHLRMPTFVVVIASLVTIIQQLLAAFAFGLHQALGIFLALITTNCLIMARAETFAYRHGVLAALIDGVQQGFGFLWVLLLLGAGRELIGHGTLLQGIYPIQLLAEDHTFLFAVLPPGAFIALALLIAIKNFHSAAKTKRECS